MGGRSLGSIVHVGLALLLLVLLSSPATAHRSGCHRWHSCPSDTGSYTCGDLGYCSGCPDNQFCEGGSLRRPAQSAPERDRTEERGAPPAGPAGPASTTPDGACPPSHPIKGNFTTYSGERCIYHVPGGQFYYRTRPERCYATEQDAVIDGCRRSRR